MQLLASEEPRIKYIDVNKYITSESDITDSIDHYQTRVYYEIAQEMIRIVGEVTGAKLDGYSASKARRDKILINVRDMIKKHLRRDGKLFALLQKVYRKMVNK